MILSLMSTPESFQKSEAVVTVWSTWSSKSMQSKASGDTTLLYADSFCSFMRSSLQYGPSIHKELFHIYAAS